MTSYRVLSKVASGGNATVYRAVAEGALGVTRLVALKKPHPHLLDDPDVADAFRREAAISVRLDHPNVVRVFDVVEHEASPALVLELVDGMTLSELVRAQVKSGRGSASIGAALAIVAEAARGLHALHEAKDDDGQPLGLLHRDVSPQNVLLDRSGAVKISDFGLVKAIASKDPATTEGILKGKVGYLAPEYVSGAALDRRSDVFALGVVAWEALAKKRLFRAEREVEVLERIRTMPIPSLREATGALADALDGVIARALERDVAARYPTARAFADALEAVARDHALDAGAEAIANELALATGAAPRRGESEPPPAAANVAPNDVPTVTEIVAAPAEPSATWQLATSDVEIVAEAAPPAPRRNIARYALGGIVGVAVAAVALYAAPRSTHVDPVPAATSAAPATEGPASGVDADTVPPAAPAPLVEERPPSSATAPAALPTSNTPPPPKPKPSPSGAAAPAAPASGAPRPNPYAH